MTPVTTFVVLWNPKDWEFHDLQYLARRLRLAGAASDAWSSGTRWSGISAGDRIFLIKVRQHPLGIIASGTATGGIFVGPSWAEDDPRDMPYVPVEWDALLTPDTVLPRAVLQEAIPAKEWTFQGGGAQLAAEVAEQLEVLWRDHLAGLGWRFPFESPELEEYRRLCDWFNSQLPELDPDAPWRPGSVTTTDPAAVDRLLKAPAAADALSVLALYLDAAELVDGTWGVSCLPKSSSSTRRTAYRVNIGGTEAMYTTLGPDGEFVRWSVLINESARERAEYLGLETSATQHGVFVHHGDPYALVAASADDELSDAITSVVAGPEYTGRVRRDAWHNERLATLVMNALRPDGFNDEIERGYRIVVARQRRHQRRFRRLLLTHYPHRCVVCGFDVVELLEAAHLVPDSLGGPSSIANGRLMCPNHHRAHDAGMFHLDRDGRPDWSDQSMKFGRPAMG